MSEMEDKIECTVEWFGNRIVDKLKAQLERGKGDWKDVPTSHLVRRLLEEVGELADALLDDAKPHQILYECVDVAAIAMMIADNLEN